MNTSARRESGEALRVRVEAAIKQKVPDSVWREVLQDTKELALGNAPGAFGDLLDEVRRLLRVRSDGEHRKRQPPTRDYRQPRLPDREEQRSSVLKEAFTWLARGKGSLRKFREKYLGGTPLTAEEVSGFLRSEVYRYLSGEQMAERGLPTARVSSWRAGSRTKMVRLADNSSIAITATRLECSWKPQGSAAVTVNVPVLPSTNTPPWMTFLGRIRNSVQTFSFEYLPGSVLAELVDVAEKLAGDFHWPQAEALLFVLVDAPVPSPAIHTDVTQHQGYVVTSGRITMHIQPWASADVVRSVYQHARRWMLGRDSRALSADSLSSYARVSDLRRAQPNATWRELSGLLSVPGPKRTRRTWRVVRQGFLRTEKSLLRPRFRMGGPGRPVLGSPSLRSEAG